MWNMRYLGKSAKKVRVQSGMTQVKFAEKLGISVVHLSNIENDHSMPSPELVNKYRVITGIDLYVLDWCDNGDLESLPKSVREAASRLREAWTSGKKNNIEDGGSFDKV
jgi:transcriptional regulator with XRE-family HTH domain